MTDSMNDSTPIATKNSIDLSWLWWSGGALCVLFCAASFVFPFAMTSGRMDMWSSIISLLASRDYVFGPASSDAVMRPVYVAQAPILGVHTILGAFAFLAAMTQFVPGFRHQSPRLHITAGVLVIFGVAAMTLAAIWMMLTRPLGATYSGEVFTVGLLSLAGMTLLALSLAAFAVRAGEYRVHMGWMALMFACLVTAPMMRILWAVYGAAGAKSMEVTNLSVGVYLLPSALFVMAIWMRTVGQPDLGADPVKSFLPRRPLWWLCIAAAAVAFHEGVMAPIGIDVLGLVRKPADRLPLIGLVWGLATSAAALQVPDEMRRLAAGESVTRTGKLMGLLSAAGALYIAINHSSDGIQRLAQTTFFAVYGVQVLATNAVAGKALDGGRAWESQWLFLTLAPGLWPVLALALAPLGMGAAATTTAVFMDAYAVAAALGFASAFGLKIVLRRRVSN